MKSGHGHGGARSMHMGGAALHQAAQMVIAKGHTLAAHLLQADPDEVTFASGRFTVGGERGVDLLDVAAAAHDPANLPDGMTQGLDADAYNDSDLFTFPNGCHAAEVEIDPETGAVTLERYLAIDDYGRLINPMLTAGQVQGGLAQGIGQAMLERTVYDDEFGAAPQRLADGLRLAARRRPAAARYRARRGADRPQPSGRQGRGSGRVHRGAADDRARDNRRAVPARHQAHRHAGDPRTHLARDPRQPERTS